MTITEPWPRGTMRSSYPSSCGGHPGDALVRIRMGTPRFLVASKVRRLDCTRAMPWGNSIAINEVRGPRPWEMTFHRSRSRCSRET